MLELKKFKLPRVAMLLAIVIMQACITVVSEEAEVAQEDPYNGIRRSFRKDGTLLAEVTYQDSIRHGVAKNFYKNGNVKLEITYQRGIKHGESITYYENGDVYLITPYVDDIKQGIQKKYYPGNILMAEIPFENDEQVPGLKEYSREGKLLTKEPRVVFQLIDKTARENKFDLLMRLSDNSSHARFGLYYVIDGNFAGHNYIPTEKGIATYSFDLGPGESLVQTVQVRAERRTRLGNTEIFIGRYHLDIENNKQP